jgi:hypothetical protein
VFPFCSIGLSASASSGLAVTFSVISGAALIEDGTNLVFSGLGPVAVTQASGERQLPRRAHATNVYTASGGNLFMIGADGVLFGSARSPRRRAATILELWRRTRRCRSCSPSRTPGMRPDHQRLDHHGSLGLRSPECPPRWRRAVSATSAGLCAARLGLHEAILLVASDGLPAVFELRAVGTGIKPGEIGLNSVFLGFAATYGDSETAAATYTITNKGGPDFHTNTVASGNGADWFALHAATGWLEPARFRYTQAS